MDSCCAFLLMSGVSEFCIHDTMCNNCKSDPHWTLGISVTVWTQHALFYTDFNSRDGFKEYRSWAIGENTVIITLQLMDHTLCHHSSHLYSTTAISVDTHRSGSHLKCTIRQSTAVPSIHRSKKTSSTQTMYSVYWKNTCHQT